MGHELTRPGRQKARPPRPFRDHSQTSHRPSHQPSPAQPNPLTLPQGAGRIRQTDRQTDQPKRSRRRSKRRPFRGAGASGHRVICVSAYLRIWTSGHLGCRMGMGKPGQSVASSVIRHRLGRAYGTYSYTHTRTAQNWNDLFSYHCHRLLSPSHQPSRPGKRRLCR